MYKLLFLWATAWPILVARYAPSFIKSAETTFGYLALLTLVQGACWAPMIGAHIGLSTHYDFLWNVLGGADQDPIVFWDEHLPYVRLCAISQVVPSTVLLVSVRKEQNALRRRLATFVMSCVFLLYVSALMPRPGMPG